MRFIGNLHRRRAQPVKRGLRERPSTAIARIWRSYTAKRGACHPSVVFFGRFWLEPLSAHRSGRRARVRASASACRQAATLAWSPEARISGIGRPSNSCGRVYCGYSSSPSEKLSSAPGRQLAHHARQQPDAGVDQRHGGDFTAGQHVIADRDFLEPARLDHPLVDALEPAADDQGTGSGGEFRDPRLGQWPTPRAHQQARPVSARTVRRHRWPPPARRRAAPCRGRRRPACRRRCGGGRWRSPGCRAPPAPTGRTPAPCRPG